MSINKTHIAIITFTLIILLIRNSVRTVAPFDY
jgi:hypothetical protein